MYVTLCSSPARAGILLGTVRSLSPRGRAWPRPAAERYPACARGACASGPSVDHRAGLTDEVAAARATLAMWSEQPVPVLCVALLLALPSLRMLCSVLCVPAPAPPRTPKSGLPRPSGRPGRGVARAVRTTVARTARRRRPSCRRLRTVLSIRSRRSSRPGRRTCGWTLHPVRSVRPGRSRPCPHRAVFSPRCAADPPACVVLRPHIPISTNVGARGASTRCVSPDRGGHGDVALPAHGIARRGAEEQRHENRPQKFSQIGAGGRRGGRDRLGGGCRLAGGLREPAAGAAVRRDARPRFPS